MTPDTPIAQWVKRARGHHAQNQFTKRALLNQSALSLLESGVNRNPTYRTLRRIADASEGRVTLNLFVNDKPKDKP